MRYSGGGATAVRVLGDMWEMSFTDRRADVAELVREFVKNAQMPVCRITLPSARTRRTASLKYRRR